MIPKVIHLCWFSTDKFPFEIKVCIKSWEKYMPDYKIRVWSYQDAKNIGCAFIDEALERRKWAFAADVVRFYAVYHEGGIYMDSDILLYKPFDHLIPDSGFATFNEFFPEHNGHPSLQAAFFMGEKGNRFCKEMLDYYMNCHFVKPDGSLDQTISPYIMADTAEKYGYKDIEEEQHLDGLIVYPTRYMAPRNKFKRTPETFARHIVYGSWLHKKLGRKVELFVKHCLHRVKYALTGEY